MDVILIRKNLVKNRHTYLNRSIVVPWTLVSMLTVASGAISGYQAEKPAEKPNKDSKLSISMPQTSPPSKKSASNFSSLEDLEVLALRVTTLQAEAARLDNQAKQLMLKGKIRESDFSLSWDNVISKPQEVSYKSVSLTSSRLAHRNSTPNWSNSLLNFQRQASLAEFKRSIKIISKDFLHKYRSGRDNPLPHGWPLKQGRVSSGFGWRGRRMHKGIDIAAPTGTPIFAVEDGIVVRSKYLRGYGKIVEIQHSEMYSTRYAHNSKNFVKVGDGVTKGQVIALVGSTGRSTGPHVHFEVRQMGIALNPVKYLATMDSFTLSSENIKLSEQVRLSKK